MRVLHLIDLRDNSDEARIACRAAIANGAARHRILGLGSSADAARTRAAGIPIDSFAPPIGPIPELSARRVKRLIADRDGRDARRPWADVVQCWSPGLLGLARIASGQRTPPRVAALLRPPLVPLGGFERARLGQGFSYATVFAFDRFVRSAWAEPVSARRGGVALEQDIRLLAPPIAAAAPTLSPQSRDAARAALGLQPADVAISLLADPPAAGDSAGFAFTLGLLFTTGARVVGLIRAGSAHQRRGFRFVRMHGRRWGLQTIPAHLSGDHVLAATDVALWTVDERAGVSSGTLSIVDALSRGVPVVAARHPISIAALGPLAHPGSPLLARDQTFNALAERLLPLVHDPAHRAQAAARCRERASALGSSHPFQDDLLRLWQEVTNTPIVREGLPMPLALLEGAA